jgi:hypothetical protein
MSALAFERSWLMNPGSLKLFHQCRRLIQSEFGVKLRLTEDDLEQRLAEYAGKTRSTDLAKTWETLVPQIPGLDISQPEEEPVKTEQDRPKRMYRGQPVPDDDTPAPSRTKIYRGQVVS